MSLWGYLGIIGPTLAGAAIVYRPRANLALTLGGGWLLGQVLVMSSLYAALYLTGASQAKAIAIGLFVAGLAIRLNKLIRPSNENDRPKQSGSRKVAQRQPKNRNSNLGWIALAILVVSMAAKLWSILPAIRDVPIRNDDAFTFWLFKAKVIAETDRLSFDSEDDFYLGGSNPRYPVFLPLLAAFVPLLEGGWNESQAAIPWIGFFIAMPLTIAGALYDRLRIIAPSQERALAGLTRNRIVSPQQALVAAALAAYVVASIPLASVHVYRSGYADLPLASFLAAAVAFAMLANVSADGRRYLIFATVMLAGATAMKREGLVFAAVIGLVAVVPQARQFIQGDVRRKGIIFATGIAAVIAVISLIDMHDIWDNLRQLEFHGEAIEPLGRHAFTWSSFNLAFWLLPIALVVICLKPRIPGRASAIALAFALIAVVASIFVLTPQYVFAMNDQTPSRLFLQILPAIVVALTVPLTAVVTRYSEA